MMRGTAASHGKEGMTSRVTIAAWKNAHKNVKTKRHSTTAPSSECDRHHAASTLCMRHVNQLNRRRASNQGRRVHNRPTGRLSAFFLFVTANQSELSAPVCSFWSKIICVAPRSTLHQPRIINTSAVLFFLCLHETDPDRFHPKRNTGVNRSDRAIGERKKEQIASWNQLKYV